MTNSVHQQPGHARLGAVAALIVAAPLIVSAVAYGTWHLSNAIPDDTSPNTPTSAAAAVAYDITSPTGSIYHFQAITGHGPKGSRTFTTSYGSGHTTQQANLSLFDDYTISVTAPPGTEITCTVRFNNHVIADGHTHNGACDLRGVVR